MCTGKDGCCHSRWPCPTSCLLNAPCASAQDVFLASRANPHSRSSNQPPESSACPHGEGREITPAQLNQEADFPGCAVVKTPCFRRRGHKFDSLVGELRLHMLQGVAKTTTTTKNPESTPRACVCAPLLQSRPDYLRPHGL